MPKSEPDARASQAERAYGIRGVVVGVDGTPVPEAFVRGFLIEKPQAWSPHHLFLTLDARAFFEDDFSGRSLLEEAKTDSDGRFLLQAAGPGDLLIEAFKPGNPDRSGDVIAGLSEKGQSVAIVIESGNTVSGAILGKADEPVAGAQVAALSVPKDRSVPKFPRLTGAGPDALFALLRDLDLCFCDIPATLLASVPSRTRTGPDGRFWFADLDPEGSYVFVARASGFAGSFEGIFQPPCSDIVIPLRETKTLRGEAVLLPEATPAARARVVSVGPLDGLSDRVSGWFDAVTCDDKGAFSIGQGPGPSVVFAHASRTSMIFGMQFIANAAFEESRRIELWRYGEVALEGRVLFENGAPVKDTVVCCWKKRHDALSYLIVEATTDAQGRFAIEGLIPQEGALVVEYPGFRQRGGPLDFRTSSEGCVDEEGEPLSGDIVLVSSPPVRGVVLDPDGRRLRGVRIELGVVPDDYSGRTMYEKIGGIHQGATALTDSTGTFTIDHSFGDGELHLWARHPELGETVVGPLPLAVKAGLQEMTVQLMAPSTVILHVSDREGLPVAGAHLEASAKSLWGGNESPFPWRRPNLLEKLSNSETVDLKPLPGYTLTVTDDRGLCKLQLIPGTPHDLVLLPSRENAEKGQIGLDRLWMATTRPFQPGETIEIDVSRSSLWGDHTLRGVVEGDGKALRGFSAWALDNGPDQGGLERTKIRVEASTPEGGPTGSFEIKGLCSETCELFVMAEGFREQQLEVSTTDDEEIRIVLERVARPEEEMK